MMDGVKKRKKLGLSLKTTKKLPGNRNKTNVVQEQGNFKLQNFPRSSDTHKPLPEVFQVPPASESEEVIIIDDDPPEAAQSRLKSHLIPRVPLANNEVGLKPSKNLPSKSINMTVSLSEETQKVSTAASSNGISVAPSQDLCRKFEATGCQKRAFIPKGGSWEELDDLPLQPLPSGQSSRGKPEDQYIGSSAPGEIKQGAQNEKEKINLFPQDTGEVNYANESVDDIYSFYSDLPKPCMVCSTRKPLCLTTFEDSKPTVVSNTHKPSQSADVGSNRDICIVDGWSHGEDVKKERAGFCIDKISSISTEKNKSGWYETKGTRRERNNVELIPNEDQTYKVSKIAKESTAPCNPLSEKCLTSESSAKVKGNCELLKSVKVNVKSQHDIVTVDSGTRQNVKSGNPKQYSFVSGISGLKDRSPLNTNEDSVVYSCTGLYGKTTNKYNINNSSGKGILYDSESRCNTKSIHLIDKSSSNTHFPEKRAATTLDAGCQSRGSDVLRTSSRSSGFRTSSSKADPLVGNDRFEGIPRNGNSYVNDTTTGIMQSACTKPIKAFTFGRGRNTVEGDSNKRETPKLSSDFEKNSKCGSSSELKSCPMCQQDFPTWTKQDAERHISNCLGFEDIVDDDDQDMEW